MSKKPKTEGYEWLYHSVRAFNGSGYADMNNAEAYLDSYVAYKVMHNKPEAVMLANKHKEQILPEIAALLEKTYGASRKPAQKYLDKFQAFRSGINEQQSIL